MLMTLRTVARNLSMVARLIPLGHSHFSHPTLWPFLLFPKTSYRPPTATRECTFPFSVSRHPTPRSTAFPLPPTNTNLTPPQKKAKQVFAVLLFAVRQFGKVRQLFASPILSIHGTTVSSTVIHFSLPTPPTHTHTHPSPTMESLPPEILHHIVFSFDLSAASTLSLSLTSHHLHTTLLGPISAPNAYDVDQLRAKGGITLCAQQNWRRAAKMALLRGYRDPETHDSMAFWWASVHNNLELTTLLLADPNFDPADHESGALARAAADGNIDILRVLLEDGRADPATAGNCPIRDAARNDHLEVVRMLASDPRVDPSDYDNEAVGYACLNGNVEMARLLLADPRVDPSWHNNEAFVLASRGGYLEIVRLLLADPRVDPSDDGNKAVQLAAEKGHLAVVALLLTDPRVDPSAHKDFALRYAARNGHSFVVTLLLTDPRVDPDALNRKPSSSNPRPTSFNPHPRYISTLLYRSPLSLCLVLSLFLFLATLIYLWATSLFSYLSEDLSKDLSEDLSDPSLPSEL